ncbi:MAG: hypothetical protein Q4G69_08965, partial [Planctomycetia bacterium]|nr:hypothetical protein [Planctomycetia bacterium]
MVPHLRCWSFGRPFPIGNAEGLFENLGICLQDNLPLTRGSRKNIDPGTRFEAERWGGARGPPFSVSLFFSNSPGEWEIAFFKNSTSIAENGGFAAGCPRWAPSQRS